MLIFYIFNIYQFVYSLVLKIRYIMHKVERNKIIIYFIVCMNLCSMYKLNQSIK